MSRNRDFRKSRRFTTTSLRAGAWDDENLLSSFIVEEPREWLRSSVPTAANRNFTSTNHGGMALAYGRKPENTCTHFYYQQMHAHAQIPRFRLQLCPPGASNDGIVECSNFRAYPAQVLRSDKMNEYYLEDQRQYNLAMMQNCC